MRHLKAADRGVKRAGVGAALMAEQFAFQESARNRSAVQCHEPFVLSWAMIVTARAMSSLPVPVSPSISTAESGGATIRTAFKARRMPCQRGRHILEDRYNLGDALVVATFLNSFVNQAHILKMANMAQLVNVIAPIFTNDQGIFLQTIYYPLQLFAANSKGKPRLSLRLAFKDEYMFRRDRDCLGP